MLILIGLLLGAAQPAPGTIRATVTDPQGGTFPVAFVQAKREPSGPTINGQGGANGLYTMQVPPGTYELSVNVPAMKPFRRGGFVVTSGQTLQVDVRLEDTVSLRTLGEDPTAIVATRDSDATYPSGTPRWDVEALSEGGAPERVFQGEVERPGADDRLQQHGDVGFTRHAGGAELLGPGDPAR